MKARDILFVAALALLAVAAFASGSAAAAEESPLAGDADSLSGNIVFDDSEVSDPTCVCSADADYLYIFLGPDEESCTAA